MRLLPLLILFLCNSHILWSQFSPAAGQAGSSALHKDSSIFKAWATQCSIIRGYQDISNSNSGFATVGDSSMAIGKAGANGVVSLGDGGVAIVSFNQPIKNGPGPDFAIFENTFIDSFLELAFVEVSSDGVNYVRFKPTSLTQDTIQTGPFGYTNPRKINNLAGKYKALWGTPFDLSELDSFGSIDINAITHIKIIDVVGSITNQYATFDQYNHKINDPWPTPFPSSGFDLDGVGIMYPTNSNIKPINIANNIVLFPNPANTSCKLEFENKSELNTDLQMTDITGRTVYRNTFYFGLGKQTVWLDLSNYANGCYQITITNGEQSHSLKLIIAHE